jgi:hypothetical protein
MIVRKIVMQRVANLLQYSWPLQGVGTIGSQYRKKVAVLEMPNQEINGIFMRALESYFGNELNDEFMKVQFDWTDAGGTNFSLSRKAAGWELQKEENVFPLQAGSPILAKVIEQLRCCFFPDGTLASQTKWQNIRLENTDLQALTQFQKGNSDQNFFLRITDCKDSLRGTTKKGYGWAHCLRSTYSLV